MITVKPITDPKIWETFVLTRDEANFLSSWNWGVFHGCLNKPVFYRGYYHQDNLLGIALVVKESAKRGSYLTIAGGPLLDWSNSTLVDAFVADISSLGQQTDCTFVRIRPQTLDSPILRKTLSDHHFTPSPMHLTADLTLQLDLTQSLDDLLSQMRKSTRYEIRKADRLNLTVTSSKDPKDIKTFHSHQLVLASKHRFVPFSYEFLFHQFQVFAQSGQALLFHARNGRHLLASAFIILYAQEAVYHYGISTPDNARLPGSYACQWAAIKAAKKQGLSRYNFWGIAPKDAPSNHRFSGVSLFKRGFGGREVAYLPAHDLPFSNLYTLTRTFESVRSKLRRLS